jgi:hypothetical protein
MSTRIALSALAFLVGGCAAKSPAETAAPAPTSVEETAVPAPTAVEETAVPAPTAVE